MKLDKNYNIENSLYLYPSEHYQNKSYYPNFQEDFDKFKNGLLYQSKNNISTNYYKFGDGDYYILSKESRGTSKPGMRDLKKKDDLNKNLKLYNQIKNGSLLCDNYLCEIKYFGLFREVMEKIDITYPAEFSYGIISSKWVFKNFKRVGLIGSQNKLDIIKNLMKHKEYQEYLGIKGFEDYIGIPQVYALSKSDQVYRKIKSKVEKSNSDIFLLGVGHVQNTILHKLKQHSKVPMVCVGCGIDAIAGLVDIKRPYFGSWKNYRLGNKKIYKNILDATMKSSNDSDVVINLK
jgi:hypothetical protein